MTEQAAEAAPEATEAPAPQPTEEVAPEAQLEEVPSDDAWKPDVAREKIRKLNQEIRSTKQKLAEAPKPDDVAAKDKRITELEEQALRLELALELQLPKDIAEVLRGSTREEMAAHAERLMQYIAPAKAATPGGKPRERLRGGGDPEVEPVETDPDKLAAMVPRDTFF